MCPRSPSLTARFKNGETLCAGWVVLDSAFAAETFAARGFDAIVLDQQHGLTHHGNALSLLQAVQGAGTPALVRIGQNAPAEITRILDLGADGVIVPLVDDAEAAARAVSAARYPPTGTRSFGPIRSALRSGDPHRAADEAAVFVMVETKRGLENVDAIAATPGLTGIFVGPADLGLGLGLGPQTDGRHPEHLKALDAIVAACRGHGIAAGIYSADPAYGRERAAQGMQLVVIASDAALLASSATARVEAWRNG